MNYNTAADSIELIETEDNTIEVLGAREHNLQNIDVSIPRNKLTVITGLSGSGKSSLAFDTIYAEGQRRYIETFSAYARQFLGNMERPDVDKITGLSPVISIEQKTTNKNPRSTVGTITEIYDFLRLLYARAADAFSYETGEKMVQYNDDQIQHIILDKFGGKRVHILAPLIRGRKGHYKELFEQIRKKGFIYTRIDGEIKEIVHGLKVDRYKVHSIEMVVDKMKIPQDTSDENFMKRLKTSIDTAMKHGKGIMMIIDAETNEMRYLSRSLMCHTSGISYNMPAPHTFSFNSPQGACPKCKGLGMIDEIDMEKIIPNRKSNIYKGGIEPLGEYKNTLIFWQIEAILKKYDFELKTPIEQIDDEVLDIILFGSEQPIRLENTPLGTLSNYKLGFDGVVKFVTQQFENSTSAQAERWATQFIKSAKCPECNGFRLKKEALNFKITGYNISEVSEWDINQLFDWITDISKDKNEILSGRQKLIAKEILKEISTRLGFLKNVGLEYLSLNRTARTLSGGESQRIRLATQIGSQLVNVLYILDEPSIGLHQRDNNRLIASLKQLRDTGNSVIVVEHDRDMIESADYIVDIGPFAGVHGGKIMASGSLQDILKSNSLTAAYLKHEKKIDIPKERRKGSDLFLELKGASGNNLKNVSVKIPLGVMVCVTGVSGSGKSTLINDTLHPIISKKLYRSNQEPLEYKAFTGMEHIDKVIEVDQSPIGRTPRSNPATYTSIFGDIRSLFEKMPESLIRGYKSGRFSFNVKGGRCEVCQGAGWRTIEMNFLPDVYVHCEECNGKRYNRETLEVRFKGKSISDVLDMTIEQANIFFESIPKISQKLKTLQDVGLGYLTLGQPSTTLSGGEAQRVKLATELSKRSTGKTLYILDEPTTGLHFEDIRVLLDVLNRLVDKGNTVIIIEHNLDVVKTADYIIDLGPEGGRGGGKILFEGTPEELINQKKGYTARFLKKEMNG